MSLRRSPLPLVLALALVACAADSGSAYERGVAAFAVGDMRTARVELLNAIQANPGNRRARLLQARVQLALGDGVAAEAEVMRAREHGVEAAQTHHLLAHAKLLQGDARAALDEAAQAPSEHEADAARIRGRAFAALGERDQAGAEFERAVALAPDDSDSWSDLGRFRRDAGDLAGALAAANRAVAARRSNVDALVLRGELTRAQYGLAAALPWFDQALEVDPDHVNALLERAITFAELGRMGDMLADARRANEVADGHPTAYYLQAALAARGGEFALARSLYARTGGAFAASPAGLLLEGAIDFGVGNDEQAAGRLTRLLALQPANRKARRLLAAVQWRMNEAAAAAETLRPIIERPDADSYSLTLAGRALSRLGRHDAAALYLARAARPQPPARAAVAAMSAADLAVLRREAQARSNDGPTQVRLIAALLARGEAREALARARRVQAANPGAPEAHLLAGDALELTGDFAGAAEQYRRAANLAFTESTALRLIEALQRSGNIAAADQVLDLFVRENPRSVAGQILLAGRMMEEGDWARAVGVYEELLGRLGSNDATVLNNLAWARSQAGDDDGAIPLARRAWALDRRNPATADTLGWLLFTSGEDRAGGLALLVRAAQGAPTAETVRSGLERRPPG